MLEQGGNTPIVMGDQGMGGGQWIWAIVLIALLGFNRHGLGGGDGGGGGHRDITSDIHNAELNARLNGIENRIDHTQDLAALRENAAAICATNANVVQNRYDAALGNMQLQKEILLGFKGAEIKALECCCETQKGIMSLGYEQQKQTCEVLRQGENNTRAVLERMAIDREQALRDQLAEARLRESQCAQNAVLIAALKPPCPVPAYLSPNPYEQYIPPVRMAPICRPPEPHFNNCAPQWA